MKWEDTIVVRTQTEIEVLDRGRRPLKLKEWAEGWLETIQTLRWEDFYEQGKGARMTHPLRDAPDWFNEGIHKMLGSGARQAWIYVAFHTGMPIDSMEATFGKLNDTNWQHNYEAQLDFFALVKEPELFCGWTHRKVQGDNPGEEYVRLVMKACAARVLSRDTQMDKIERGVLEDVATSEAPPLPKSKRYDNVKMLIGYKSFMPLFNTPPPATVRIEPDPAMGPVEPPSSPPRPNVPTHMIDSGGDPSLKTDVGVRNLEPFAPPRHRNDRGFLELNPKPKRPRREPRPQHTEYEESPSYGVLIGAIIVVGIAVYSQM